MWEEDTDPHSTLPRYESDQGRSSPFLLFTSNVIPLQHGTKRGSSVVHLFGCMLNAAH